MTQANDQYIKPIAERARKAKEDFEHFYAGKQKDFFTATLLELFAELAEKLEPAEVRTPEERK